MPHSYSVRPHLLDEDAIQRAILETGLEAHERGQIVDQLVENYTVDLDLLAASLAALKGLTRREADLARAA